MYVTGQSPSSAIIVIAVADLEDLIGRELRIPYVPAYTMFQSGVVSVVRIPNGAGRGQATRPRSNQQLVNIRIGLTCMLEVAQVYPKRARYKAAVDLLNAETQNATQSNTRERRNPKSEPEVSLPFLPLKRIWGL